MIDPFKDGHIRPLRSIEEEAIAVAVAHYRGRVSEAARWLQIGKTTLYRKLEEIKRHGSVSRPTPPDTDAGGRDGN